MNCQQIQRGFLLPKGAVLIKLETVVSYFHEYHHISLTRVILYITIGDDLDNECIAAEEAVHKKIHRSGNFLYRDNLQIAFFFIF